ncbi:MAG TPA: hypothetical protein DCR39_00520 [Nitrospiraceae bacterium]|nr:hypothetical protein [Nitrospiraceae bacterium]
MRYNSDTMVDVSSYGTTTQSIVDAIGAAKSTNRHKDLFFSPGTYYCDYSLSDAVNMFGGRFLGSSRMDTFVVNNRENVSLANIINCGAVDISLKNIRLTSNYLTMQAPLHPGWPVPRKFSIVGCELLTDDNPSSTYLFNFSFDSPRGDIPAVEIIDNVGTFGQCYSAFNLRWIRGVIFSGNSFKFTGKVSHPVAISPQWAPDSISGAKSFDDNGKIDVSNNVIDASLFGAITGIFFSASRYGVISGAVVANNKLYGIDEEGIAFDGYGNDEGLCPTICTGTLSAATNDAAGRLVVTFGSMQHVLVSGIDQCLVSGRDDWHKFRFSFNRATGQDGLIARIHSFDHLTNSLILDIPIAANTVSLSGIFSVQAGFYNCDISHNEIFGSYGADPTYGVGISLWLNCCGFSVKNNLVSGMSKGINVCGGLMLSLWETIAWHNEISGNNLMGIYNTEALAVKGIYGSQSYQYGNKVHDNYLQSGDIVMQKQKDFIFHDNYSKTGVAKFTP